MLVKAYTGRLAAESHDLIRVEGTLENDLEDVSIEIPKRRLTMFTEGCPISLGESAVPRRLERVGADARPSALK